MPSPGGQFLSDEFGDIEDYFISDYQLIDQYIGDQLWVWGRPTQGQLGIGVTSPQINTPVTTLSGGTNWKQVATIVNVTVAIKTDGTLWNWGLGGSGQLGVNDITDRLTPVTTLLGGTDWKQISSGGAGGFFTAAIKTDGSLWNWGGGGSGQLGVNDTTNRSTPVTTILGGNNWKQVSGGYRHTAAIKTDGTLWTWGRNAEGQLGINITSQRNTPVTTLSGGTNWKSVSAGREHTAAIKTDGSLWTWGFNNFGQLGVNDTTNRLTPVTTILGGTDWKTVSALRECTAAIKTNGTLWIWGRGGYGQLGVNDITNRSTPVTTIIGGTNWKSVSGGERHITAIKTDGSLWVWGRGAEGQLGVNSTLQRSTPVTTFLGGNNWKFASGYFHTVAIQSGLNVDLSENPTEISFISPGTYSWVVPIDITSVSAVLIGGGGSGARGQGGREQSGAGGGGLRYINSLPVTPGETISVVVGSGGAAVATNNVSGNDGNPSQLLRSIDVLVEAGGGIKSVYANAATTGGAGGTGTATGAGPFGGTIGGGDGGSGGDSNAATNAGGGGAGGYSGNGGTGVSSGGTFGAANQGSGGGGAGGTIDATGSNPSNGGCGGGVGLLGEGTSGATASAGGSNGTNGGAITTADAAGGLYGGGGGGVENATRGAGGDGAIRIIWSYEGPTPTFP